MDFRKQKEFSPKVLTREIWEHSIFGGYPKVVTVDDLETKKIILQDLYETMILKDVAQTFSIEDITSLENLSKYLAHNIGGIFSYERACSDIRLSFKTVKKYIDALEKSYMILRVIPFYKNKMKEIIKKPKIFFIDTGIRNILSKTISNIDGAMFENYVCSELLKMGFTPKYWRTKSKSEVDFIIEKDNEIIPIEVKLSINSTKIGRSFHSFLKEYSPKRGFIVSYNNTKGKITIGNSTIHFVDILELKNFLNK